jgi:enoyl-CoA hydratase/carnithine racemase
MHQHASSQAGTGQIAIAIEDGINVMRFTRPDKKNALTTAMYLAMNRALEEAEKDPAVAAHLFIGSGGVFSAGNDMADFLARAKGEVAATSATVDFVSRLPTLTKPVIAAVDGLAVGVGATLLFHCDLVYGTPTLSLRTPFVDLGLIPEAGSSLLGPQRLGYARAFALLVLGEPMGADAALACGLVNRIVPAGELETIAREAGQRLAAKPPEALAAARALLRGDTSAVRARIAMELRLLDDRMASPEAREAFSAFLEKRQPDFKRVGGA